MEILFQREQFLCAKQTSTLGISIFTQGIYLFCRAFNHVQLGILLVYYRLTFKGWARIVEQTDDNGNPGSYAPPRSDLNAPDLYIPVMSFITYIIITGFVTGLEKSTASTGYSFL